MNSTLVRKHYYKTSFLPEIGWPTFISAFLHIFVFFLAVMGLPQIAQQSDPYIHPDEIVMDVALFDSADVTDDSTVTKEDDAPSPPKKPIYNNTDSVPVLAEPTQPDIEKGDEKPEVIPDPTLIKVPPKPRNKPTPPKPPEVTKSETATPEKPKRNITSLLKDLTPDDWANAEARINEDGDNKSAGAGSGDASRQMTSSDLIALNQGVQKCWNVNAGGRMAENLEVKLRVFVNPDQNVREVVILDQIRYATDPHYRAAADAAQRALLHPDCRTLNLPPEKYEIWKNFIYVFDPSQML